MKTSKAIFIDSAARTVTEFDYEGGPGGSRVLNEKLGGWIEVAWAAPWGDVLYVDEEGLRKQKPGSFRWLPRYLERDYFTSDISQLLAEANSVETAEQWFRSAYLGPDHDGIGIAWTIEVDDERPL